MTGGTVIFTQIPSAGPVIDSDQSYQLDANIPLNNLTVSGKTTGTNRNASLTLMISPLVVNGNLSLANNRSVLASNNRNITIRATLSITGPTITEQTGQYLTVGCRPSRAHP